jgi:septum formation protein
MLRLPWRASAANVNEDEHLLSDPLVSALNVAAAKVRAIRASSDEVVIAADTLVAQDGRILAKPVDAADATRMLAQLRGRAHTVLTGVVLRGQRDWGGVVATAVYMRAYADEEIARYVARGEPFDKAGGYAIQDVEFAPVERLAGCYLNVVGLPVCAVAAGLVTLGVEVTQAGTPPCTYCEQGRPIVAIG